MFWRVLVVVLAGLGALGCLNSEADFQALMEENETLSAELAEAKKENEILTRALADIKQEQETLQLLLNAGQRGLNAGRAKLPLAALGSGEDQAVAEGGQEEEFMEPAALESAAPAAAAPEPAPATAAAAPEPAPATAAAPETGAAAEPAPEEPAPAPARSPGGRYYVTKPGDVLTSIARENQTTVAKLLELNPSLRNRRNYVIYNNERLRLP